MIKNVLFRCDASLAIGSGHVMRCITLGNALNSHGCQIFFLTNSGGEQVLQMHSKFPYTVLLNEPAISETLQIEQAVSGFGIDYFIWDSYSISEEQEQFVSSIVPTMIVDDTYLLSSYSCDAILNQNIYANSRLYNVRSETTVLAGNQYTQLRYSFLTYRENIKLIPEFAANILITFGGSDEANDTLRCLMWLQEMQEYRSLYITAVMGMHYAFEDQLAGCAGQFRHFQLLRNVTNMAELLWGQDLVVTAAGSTMYELACLGIPSCSLVTADNQRQVAETFAMLGTTANLGMNQTLTQQSYIHQITHLLDSYDSRKSMSDTGRKLIDGYGSSRVAQYIINR
jgi:UDP-2,4-diacetamido-2,4,6-trideoxy-beta-L-altropyranose hydrolase